MPSQPSQNKKSIKRFFGENLSLILSTYLFCVILKKNLLAFYRLMVLL